MTMLGAKIAAARAVGELARRAGRGGGTSLPGKVLMALEPGAISELSARLPRGSVVISATNGKTTTAAMVASVLEAAPAFRSSTTEPARTWPAASPRRCSRPRAAAGGSTASSGCSRSTSSGSTGSRPSCDPRGILLGNLFRDQLDRYGELETIADRWAAVASASAAGAVGAARAERRRPADRRSRARRAERHVLRRRGSVGGDRRRCSTRRTRSTAAGAAPRTSTTRSTSAISVATAAPRAGSERPAPSVAAERISLDGTRRSSFELTHAGRERHGRAAAPRALQRLQRARRRGAVPRARASRCTAVVAGLRDVQAAFGRAERIAIGDVELQVLLIKNPAGANEILRTLVLEHEELDVLAVLNDRMADGRDVSWVWDADFEMLAGRVRRVTCAGTRAAELAVRLKYAGVPADRLHVTPALAGGARRGARRRSSRGTCTRCRRTRRCSSSVRSWPTAATRSGSGSRHGGGAPMSVHLARPRVRRLRRGPAAVALARGRARRPGARYRRGHGSRDAGSRAAPGTASLRSTAIRSCSPRSQSGPREETSEHGRFFPSARHDRGRRRSRLRPRRAVSAGHRADADDPAARRPGRPGRVPGLRAPAPAARRGAGDRDRRGPRSLRRDRRRAVAHCPTSASSTASCTRASRSRSAPIPTGSCSSACGRRSRWRASEPSSAT